MKRRRNPLEVLRLLNPAQNPASSLPAAVRRYRNFHEAEPQSITERTCWVPGELVLLGLGVEINYEVLAPESVKDAGTRYVHEFEANVKLYRRAHAEEAADVVWRNFPGELTVIGRALEFSWVADDDGESYETRPAKTDKLATTPDGRTLAIVDARGNVKFVARGGKLKVTNWIYH